MEHTPVSLICVDVARSNRCVMQSSVLDCYGRLVRVWLDFFWDGTVSGLPPDDGGSALLQGYRMAQRARLRVDSGLEWRSTSAIHKVHGSVARMRTPTACYDSTARRRVRKPFRLRTGCRRLRLEHPTAQNARMENARRSSRPVPRRAV